MFDPKWREGREWLEYNEANETMGCAVCRAGGETGKWARNTITRLRLEAITSHANSTQHRTHMEARKGSLAVVPSPPATVTGTPRRNRPVIAESGSSLVLSGKVIPDPVWSMMEEYASAGDVVAWCKVSRTTYHMMKDVLGGWIATGGQDSAARVWHPRCGQRLKLPGHLNSVTAVAWSPRSNLLAAGDYNGGVRVWNCETGEIARKFPKTKFPGSIRGCDFSPDGTLLATAGWDQATRIWDVATGYLRRSFGKEEPLKDESHWDYRLEEPDDPNYKLTVVSGIRFSPDGKRIATSGPDPKLHIWNVEEGTLERIIDNDHDHIGDLAWRPDGLAIAVAYTPKTRDNYGVEVWSLVDGDLLTTLKGGHTAVIKGVAYSPCGKKIATCSNDGTVAIWDATTATVTTRFRGHTDWVEACTFSPNGKLVASVSWDARLLIHDVVSGSIYDIFISPSSKNYKLLSVAWRHNSDHISIKGFS